MKTGERVGKNSKKNFKKNNCKINGRMQTPSSKCSSCKAPICFNCFNQCELRTCLKVFCKNCIPAKCDHRLTQKRERSLSRHEIEIRDLILDKVDNGNAQNLIKKETSHFDIFSVPLKKGKSEKEEVDSTITTFSQQKKQQFTIRNILNIKDLRKELLPYLQVGSNHALKEAIYHKSLIPIVKNKYCENQKISNTIIIKSNFCELCWEIKSPWHPQSKPKTFFGNFSFGNTNPLGGYTKCFWCKKQIHVYCAKKRVFKDPSKDKKKWILVDNKLVPGSSALHWCREMCETKIPEEMKDKLGKIIPWDIDDLVEYRKRVI